MGIRVKQIAATSVAMRQRRRAKYNTLKNLKWGLSSVFAAAVKYDYIKSNPVPAAELPPADIREEATLPQDSDLELLIAHLPDPLSEAVWLAAVTCIRPEEIGVQVVRPRPGKVPTVDRPGRQPRRAAHAQVPPNQPSDSTYRIGCATVAGVKAADVGADDDWMFPNKRRTGPIGHEQIMGRVVQPIARQLGLPHITWRILCHWGTTQMMEDRVPIKAAQQRLGHSRPDILLKHYAHLLEESAEFAAETLSGKLGGDAEKTSDSTEDSPAIGSQTAAKGKRWVM